MDRQPWERLPNETTKAYAAFTRYYQTPAHERSIDAAYDAHLASETDRSRIGKRGSGQWRAWAVNHDWVARATAYDEYLADQDRELWERRRAELRQRDWDQADALRGVVADALPHAQQFIHSQRRVIAGRDGEPDREIITVNFDITGLARVLAEASKLQRLATDEPTDNINLLSGAALDAIITRRLAALADGAETRIAGAIAEDEPGADAGAGAGATSLQE